MDQMKLASGDNSNHNTSPEKNELSYRSVLDEPATEKSTEVQQSNRESNSSNKIYDNETKLKERIAQCKDILTSLKLELNEEKIKLFKEGRVGELQSVKSLSKFSYLDNNNVETIEQIEDLPLTTNMYTSSIDCKLLCDENLLEYEKQLQIYQKTLSMAQIEKKNAIKKQMLAKAFKLKLLEIENQCNIELIRIKQSLQCLEPLKLIAEKWKSNNNDSNYDTFELIPRYPELSTPSGSDISNISNADDCDSKLLI